MSSTRHECSGVGALTRRQVSNDSVLQGVVDEIVASGDIKGKVYIDCSTVHPDTSLAVSKRISEAGGEFVAGKTRLLPESTYTC
jgi:hypothetical protein